MIYITSDEHYAHSNIIKYCNRPFIHTYEMEKGLIANHNSVVKSNDVVYHLGDFSFDREKNKIKYILSQLNGTNYLIAGNHDGCHPISKKKYAKTFQDYIDFGFKDVVLSME